MKNSFGDSITFTIFGESHGSEVGMVIDGLAPGIPIDDEYIKRKLYLRRPKGEISTPRIENDDYDIVSGVFNGYTTGAPLTIVIPNTNIKSEDYAEIAKHPRPSHADLGAYFKYKGFHDYRGSGHFSGRLTAALVAAGAIVMKPLEEKGIQIGTHILSCGHTWDRRFKNVANDIEAVKDVIFPLLEQDKVKPMIEEILEAKAEGDSLGGILETGVVGMPRGIGEPFFDSVESHISRMMFSIPAIKGIEFGKGFNISQMKGSKANDQIKKIAKGIKTSTNHNGGINGGITNGMPIIFKTAIKPTPTIGKEQHTINIDTGEKVMIKLDGRHDPAIVHRASIVVSCGCAIALADLLTTHFGTNYLGE